MLELVVVCGRQAIRDVGMAVCGGLMGDRVGWDEVEGGAVEECGNGAEGFTVPMTLARTLESHVEDSSHVVREWRRGGRPPRRPQLGQPILEPLNDKQRVSH